MGIETRYEYIYYTIINTSQLGPATCEEWFNDGFTWDEAINYVEHQFKTSEDKSVNNYRVEYAQWCDDIKFWRHKLMQHKEMPIFIQFQQDQEIKKKGEGELFVFYEEQEDEDDNMFTNEYNRIHSPDDDNYGTIDGLASAGGRL